MNSNQSKSDSDATEGTVCKDCAPGGSKPANYAFETLSKLRLSTADMHKLLRQAATAFEAELNATAEKNNFCRYNPANNLFGINELLTKYPCVDKVWISDLNIYNQLHKIYGGRVLFMAAPKGDRFGVRLKQICEIQQGISSGAKK